MRTIIVLLFGLLAVSLSVATLLAEMILTVPLAEPTTS